MKITIREADPSMIQHLKKSGSSFEVRSKLSLHAENGKIHYTIVDVPPYTKHYGTEEFAAESYLGKPGRVIFLAYVENEHAGQIRLRTNWNGFAYIDYIAIETAHRSRGVGRALMEHAIHWAKGKGFPGIVLETQDINVPACKFYESCGFKLGGFDTYIYKAQDPSTDEIALFWYLIF